MRREDKAGLQIAIIFHLVALIVLLVFGIGHEVIGEHSFVLDFSKQEEHERQQKEEAFQQDVSKRVDDLISKANKSNPIRNVAVNGTLRDDRNSDKEARELYKKAEELSNELKQGYKSDIEEDARQETVQTTPDKGSKNQVEYSGPSVLSWKLEGRKASHLPIPAYRCYGSGEVHVVIVVDPQGKVVNAKVDESLSAADECLRNFAVRAARMSRFSQSTSAPTRQVGEITYSFIAQ